MVAVVGPSGSGKTTLAWRRWAPPAVASNWRDASC
ncbi:hypothetical protein NKH77_46830 [Streptomyces sp. M19]